MMSYSRARLVAVLLFAPSVALAGEQVGTKSQSYLVTYPDNAKETYVANYVASVSDTKNESGHPMILEKGWLNDTRQCHWTITAEIVRELCLVSRNGQQFCDKLPSKVFNTLKTGKGSDLIVLNAAPENCGKAEARHASDKNNVTDGVIEALPKVVAEDTKTLVNDLKDQLKAVTVTAQ